MKLKVGMKARYKCDRKHPADDLFREDKDGAIVTVTKVKDKTLLQYVVRFPGEDLEHDMYEHELIPLSTDDNICYTPFNKPGDPL